MAIHSQLLNKFDSVIGVAYSISVAFAGVISTLFLLLLFVATRPFASIQQRNQIGSAISWCAGLIWGGCAGLLGASFLETGYE